MGDTFPEPRDVALCPGRGQARLRRIKRGAARWLTAVRWDRRRVRRFVELTLTLAADDPKAAENQVRRFWRAARDAWGEQRYFCWLELQRRGQLHYHAVWLVSQKARASLTKEWVRDAWRLGRTSVTWRDGRSFRDDAMQYALGYAKKRGRKSYQQDYTDVPIGVHTFMTHRLGYDQELLDAHADRWIASYIPARGDGQTYVEAHIQLHGVLRHLNKEGCRGTRPGRRPIDLSIALHGGP